MTSPPAVCNTYVCMYMCMNVYIFIYMCMYIRPRME